MGSALRLLTAFMIAWAFVDVLFLGGLQLVQMIGATVGIALPARIYPPTLAQWVVLENPLSQLLTDEGSPAPAPIRWLANSTWLALTLSTTPLAATLIRWKPIDTIAHRLFPALPAFMRPIEKPLAPQRQLFGRDKPLAEVNEFLHDPIESLAFGVCGRGAGGSHLVRYALRSLPGSWLVGTLTGPVDPTFQVGRPIAVIVDAKTATPEIWDAAADLLEKRGRVRVLIDSDVDFPLLPLRVADVAARLDRKLFHRGGDAPSAAGFGLGVVRQIASTKTKSNRSAGGIGDSAGPEATDRTRFASLDRLSDNDMLRIAILWVAFLKPSPRPTEEQLRETVARAGGLPRLLVRDLRGVSDPGETAERTEAEGLIARATSVDVFGLEGFKVVILAALGAVRPIPAEVRKKVAPNSGDRHLLRALFGVQSGIDDDQFMPAIKSRSVAWEALLQALSRLQSPDRREILELIADVDPDIILSAALELLEQRGESRLARNAILAGPRDMWAVVPGPQPADIGSKVHFALIIRDFVVTAIGQSNNEKDPSGRLNARRLKPIERLVAPSASSVAGRLGDADRSPLLEMLAILRPEERLMYEMLGRSRIWRTHPQALAALLSVVINNEARHVALGVSPSDPTRTALENLDLLNDAYFLAGQPVLDRQVDDMLARAQRMVPSFTSKDPIERSMAVWAAYWLLCAHLTWPPVVRSPLVEDAVISAANDETLALQDWGRAAFAAAKIATGTIETDLVLEWAYYADGVRPRPATPTRIVGLAMERVTTALEIANERLSSEHINVKRAAALLRLAYFDDPLAAAVAAEAFIDADGYESDLQLSFLYRLIQNGSPVAIAAIANAFRKTDSEWARVRIYLCLLALDDAAALSDKDLDPTGQDPDTFRRHRASVVERQKMRTAPPPPQPVTTRSKSSSRRWWSPGQPQAKRRAH